MTAMAANTTCNYGEHNALAMCTGNITSHTGACNPSNRRMMFVPVAAEHMLGRKPMEKSITTGVTFITRQPLIDDAREVVIRAITVLNVAKHQIAKLFGVSRQHIYTLVKDPNIVVGRDIELRATEINKALEVISNLTNHRLGASAMVVKIDGVNLIDVLSELPIDLAKVAEFTQIIDGKIEKDSAPDMLPDKTIDQQEYMDTPGTA